MLGEIQSAVKTLHQMFCAFHRLSREIQDRWIDAKKYSKAPQDEFAKINQMKRTLVGIVQKKSLFFFKSHQKNIYMTIHGRE